MPPKPIIYHLLFYKLTVKFFGRKRTSKWFVTFLLLFLIFGFVVTMNHFLVLSKIFSIGYYILLGWGLLTAIDRIMILIQLDALFKKFFISRTLDDEFRFNMYLSYYNYQWAI